MTTTLTPAGIFIKEQVLTLAKARQLQGKKVATTSREYRMNTPHVNVFVVGEIISSWEDAAKKPYHNDNFDTVQDYWKSYMNDQQVDEEKDRLILFSEDGSSQHQCCVNHNNWFAEPTFHGSDADREVYYIELK